MLGEEGDDLGLMMGRPGIGLGDLLWMILSRSALEVAKGR